jgi:hypothetical protein
MVLLWTPSFRESATPAPCWRATSVLQETAHQPAICYFAKEIDASYVLRAGRKKQFDRMDFKSSLSLVSSKNGWVRVGNELWKRFGVAEGSTGSGPIQTPDLLVRS